MFFRYTYPAFLWAGFILLLTLTAGSEFPKVSLLSVDKIIHIFLFAVQSYLFICSFKRQSGFIFLRYHPVISSLILCLLFAASTELMQAYLLFDRSGDVFDFIANGIGAVSGVLIFVILYGKPSYSR